MKIYLYIRGEGKKAEISITFGKIPDKNCSTRGVNSDYGRELKFQRRICFGQPYHAQANFALVIWKSAGNHGHPHSHRLVTHDRDVTQSARIYACTVERGSRSPVYVVSTLVALANSCRAADTDKRDKKRKRRKEKKNTDRERERMRARAFAGRSASPATSTTMPIVIAGNVGSKRHR